LSSKVLYGLELLHVHQLSSMQVRNGGSIAMVSSAAKTLERHTCSRFLYPYHSLDNPYTISEACPQLPLPVALFTPVFRGLGMSFPCTQLSRSLEPMATQNPVLLSPENVSTWSPVGMEKKMRICHSFLDLQSCYYLEGRAGLKLYLVSYG
jgi:hypothetical protein